MAFSSLPTDDKMVSLPTVSIEEDFSSLDEPVMETIVCILCVEIKKQLRDVNMIGYKIAHVLLPRDATDELKDWDLWGPLLLCLGLSLSLSLNASENQSALVFATVFVLVWVGSAVVTLNAALLGGKTCVCCFF